MRSLARSLLVALLAIVAFVTLAPDAIAAVAAVVQDVALPPEIPAAYAVLIGAITSAVLGAAKYVSAKVRALPDAVKMVLALVAGFAYPFAVKAVAAIGLTLPGTLAGFEDVGALTVLVGGAVAMGLRAIVKALLPGLSAAVKV